MAFFMLLAGSSSAQDIGNALENYSAVIAQPAVWNGGAPYRTPIGHGLPAHQKLPALLASRFSIFEGQKLTGLSKNTRGGFEVGPEDTPLQVWPCNARSKAYTYSAGGLLTLQGKPCEFSALSTTRKVHSVYDEQLGTMQAAERVTHVWLPDHPQQLAIKLREYLLFSPLTGAVGGYFRSWQSSADREAHRTGWLKSVRPSNKSVDFTVEQTGAGAAIVASREITGHYNVFDITGKLLQRGKIEHDSRWRIKPGRANGGIYLIRVVLKDGTYLVRRISMPYNQ